MQNFKPDFKPKVRDELSFRELDDGGLVYEAQGEKVHSLNRSAAYIWALCDGTYTIAEIINAIKTDFSEFSSDPAEEIQKILRQFSELGLLSIS